jgi:G3E family GTPase
VHIKRFENGCICCDLQEDLLEEVARLAASGDFDYLAVECTGAAEPTPIAEAFTAAMIAKDGTIHAAADGHEHDNHDLEPFSSVAQLGGPSIRCKRWFSTTVL